MRLKQVTRFPDASIPSLRCAPASAPAHHHRRPACPAAARSGRDGAYAGASSRRAPGPSPYQQVPQPTRGHIVEPSQQQTHQPLHPASQPRSSTPRPLAAAQQPPPRQMPMAMPEQYKDPYAAAVPLSGHGMPSAPPAAPSPVHAAPTPPRPLQGRRRQASSPSSTTTRRRWQRESPTSRLAPMKASSHPAAAAHV